MPKLAKWRSLQVQNTIPVALHPFMGIYILYIIYFVHGIWFLYFIHTSTDHNSIHEHRDPFTNTRSIWPAAPCHDDDVHLVFVVLYIKDHIVCVCAWLMCWAKINMYLIYVMCMTRGEKTHTTKWRLWGAHRDLKWTECMAARPLDFAIVW